MPHAVGAAPRRIRGLAIPALAVLLVVLAPPVARGTPFSPTTLDSTVLACMAEIDPDSLSATIAALQQN